VRLPSRTRTPRASRNASSYPCSGPVVLVTGLILVGRRGVEPRDTCLSGRPRRPAGSRPADGGGPDPQTAVLSRPLQTGACRPAGSPSKRGERATRTPAPYDARPLSGRCLHPGRFTLHARKTEKSNPSASRRPHGFQPRPGPCPVHLPSRRVEQSKPTPRLGTRTR